MSFEADSLDSLYRFFDYEGGLLTLRNKKLRFKTADQFNDPYELRPESFIPDFDLSKLNSTDFLEEVSKINVEPLKTLLTMVLKSVPKEVVEEQMRPVISSSINTYVENSRKVFDIYKKTSFINCLTHRVNDVKMWADYANKGTGIAIEFEVSVKRDNFFRCAKPVKYLSSVPKFYNSLSDLFEQSRKASLPENWKDLFEHFSYCKSDDWKKEEEWRIIIPDMTSNSYCDYDFHEDDVRAVYLGYAVKDKDKIINEIKNYFSNPKVYLSSLDNKVQGLNFNEVE